MKIFAERENVNDEEVVISDIYFKNTDRVSAGDLILDLETSKTSIGIDAPKEGFIKFFVTKDQEIPIGECLFEIFDTVEECETDLSPKLTEPKNDPEQAKYIFTKEAKDKIKELNISNYSFNKKMVTLDDVMEFIKDDNSLSSENTPLDATNSYQSSEDKSIDESKKVPEDLNLDLNKNFAIKKHTLRKRSEIKNLSQNGNQSTQSVIGISVNTLPQRSYEDVPYIFQDSIGDLVSYEAAKIIHKYPQLNSFFIDDKTYGEYESINIGYSFDDGSNLKVLAIIDADKMSLRETQDCIFSLLELYESEQTISSELLTSSTITVSDLSRYQSSFMIPLVSAQQSSIIGIVKSDNYQFNIYLGFDHKVSSGQYVSAFLEELKLNIESHFYTENIDQFLSCDQCEITAKESKLLGHNGFIKIIGFDGKEKKICENCFNGF